MAMPNVEAAVSAFRATLERLEETVVEVERGSAPAAADGRADAPPALDLDEEVGERAALMVVAGRLWRRHLGPLLTTADLQKMGGRSRQAVHDLVRRGRLLALPSGGRTLYPAFQLDAAGRPSPAVAEVLAAFEGTVESPFTVASWFRTPQPLLGDRTPADWLAAGEDPAPVVQAARRTAAKLRR